MCLLSTLDESALQIQKYFISNPGTKITITELSAALDISKYNVQRDLETLQNLYDEAFQGYQPSFVFLVENKTIQISKLQVIHVEQVKYVLTQNAIKMKLLNAFFLEEYETVEELLEEFNISYSLLRKLIREMNRFLLPYEIVISNNLILKGNEFNIRRLMMENYYLYNDDLDLLFEDAEFPDENVLPEALPKSSTHTKAYRAMRIVWYVRIKNNHPMTESLQYIDFDLFRASNPQIYQDIVKNYDSLGVSLSPEQTEFEIEYGLLVNLVRGKINLNILYNCLTPYMKQQLQLIGDIVQDEFEKMFSKRMDDDDLAFVMEKLLISNIQLITLSSSIINRPTYKAVDGRVYLLSYGLSINIGHRFVENFNITLTDVEKMLITEYVTVFHGLIVNTQGKYVPVLNVAVDMVDLINLQEETMQILNAESLFKIHTTREISEDTDVIISDIPLLGANVPNIIWHSLPDYDDLFNFHKLIGQIIMDKIGSRRIQHI